MPIPAGFVEEGQPTVQAKPEISNVPAGFVDESSVVPELRAAPPKTAYEKLRSFFTDDEKQIAQAQNIYALSEVTGLPINEVNRNYHHLRRSTDVTGIQSEPTEREVLQGLMLPGVVAGAIANPIGTAAGFIAFGALEKAIPTQKLIQKMEDEGVYDEAIKAIELVDMVGKSLIAGGIFKKVRSLPESFLQRKIVEYKLPQTVTLTPAQVRDIYQTGQLTTPEQKSLWAGLELNSFDMRAAFEHGININVPTSKTVRVVDNPLWGKVKQMLGMPLEAQKTTTTATGPSKGPTALLEAPMGQEMAKKPKIDPVKKFITALSEAADIRSKQETLDAKGRARQFARMMSARERTSGEKGYYAQLGALKGELPKAEFESLRGKIEQEDIDALFDIVKVSKAIGEFEKLTAYSGLAKMLGLYGGRVPTESELALLNAVFGEEFTKAVLEKRTDVEKLLSMAGQVLSVPRSIMSSLDLSAPLRQGIFLIGRPAQYLPAFGQMFTVFISEKAYLDLQDAIITHPDYQLSRDSRLALTDQGVLMSSREEAFMSDLAEKIFIVGAGVKASRRAYTGFLNKLRFDVFVDLVNKAEILGLDPRNNRDLTVNIADFINNATGRGTLPFGLERSAVTLNNVFFSPRLMASRLNLLNPAYYVKLDPFVRKEALKSLFTFLGAGLTVLTLAKLAGAEVGSEPRSADFGKVKIRNTRYDVWGGFQPWVRVFAQIISGKYISSVTGKEMTLGEGYKAMSRADIIQRFLEGKLAPIPSFIWKIAKQQDQAGEPVSVTKEALRLIYPMSFETMAELAKEDPELLPSGLLAFFGTGVQTYSKKRKKKKK